MKTEESTTATTAEESTTYDDYFDGGEFFREFMDNLDAMAALGE